MNQNKEVRIFLHCKKCNKRLIERMSNGLFKFVFGSRRDKSGESLQSPPVYMLIHGSVKMKCVRKSCNEDNVFHFFPIVQSEKSSESNPTIETKQD